jgi:DNA repair protein RadC
MRRSKDIYLSENRPALDPATQGLGEKTTDPRDRIEGPREKIAASGIGSLSDAELLEAILGSGSRGRRLKELASDILLLLDSHKGSPGLREFKAVKGIGAARASALASALELGRRRFKPGDMRISHPSDVYPLIAHYADRKQERFIVVSLNGAHEVIAVRVASIGLLNRTLIHPREVFADPLSDRAAAVIVAHNHPSGRLEPSQEDIDITERLAKAGKTIGVGLLDHLIFSWEGYWSFLESGSQALNTETS